MNSDAIKQLEIWSHLTKEQRKLLLQTAIVRVVAKDNVLFHEGEKGKHVGVLVKGKLHLVQPVAGRPNVILHVVRSGELFGETLFTHSGVYEYQAKTVEESTIVFVLLTTFLRLFQQNPMVCWSFFYAVVKRMRNAENRLLDYHLLSVGHRLRKVIRGYMEREGRQLLNGEVEIVCRLPHELLAKLCISSRHHITLNLNSLREQGIIKYDRRRMLILRPDLL